MLNLQRFRTPLVLLLMTLAILGFLIATGVLLNRQGLVSEMRLPILAVVGVICVVAVLALVAAAFSMMDLQDKAQAWALPEGSIRSVIALALIVIFAITSIFLYSNLSGRDVKVRVLRMTAAQQATFESQARSASSSIDLIAIVPSGAGTVLAYYSDRPNGTAQDFAKQLLTLLGTLVTSVSSFYFGARSASAAAEGAVRVATDMAKGKGGASAPDGVVPGGAVPVPG